MPSLPLAAAVGSRRVRGLQALVLLVLQRSDLERVAHGDGAAGSRAAAEGGRGVQNPATISEPELWAAMAVAPIDADALRAREETWDVSRRSNRLGFVIVILIFLTVPTIYLTESFVPLLIGGPLIVIAALYGAFRAIGPDGEIERSYDRTDRAMAPLGLALTETPKGGFEMRYPATPGFDYRLRGWTVISGERHGRQVAVRLGGHEDAGTTEVIVAGGGPRWSARSRDGRIRPGEGAPAALVAACEAVPNSTRWKRVEVEAGPEGLVVRRRKGEQRDWLCDLWLAERLASV
ncbi:MAG: hypothetical protein ACOYD4_07175 [Solirubrobacterales bacterium]